jgi:hypothetical protein
MADEPIRGVLQMTGGQGAPSELREVAFASLQELLNLCAQHEGAAFVRVEIRGSSMDLPRTLVLDFGQFSPRAP